MVILAKDSVQGIKEKPLAGFDVAEDFGGSQKEVEMSHQKKITTLHQAGREKGKATQGIPLIVIYWAFALGITGYIVSRFVFTQHPLHWASGAGGLLLGAVIGYIWFFIRGDVGLI